MGNGIRDKEAMRNRQIDEKPVAMLCVLALQRIRAQKICGLRTGSSKRRLKWVHMKRSSFGNDVTLPAMSDKWCGTLHQLPAFSSPCDIETSHPAAFAIRCA
ncbi:hypothetical protein [Primorskyibacter flagellatus]|uniref:hypothetical protein n=1 Tax=Primorskyibacter flagellatus TaxID=1387277 RepID=UPI00117B8499|nr:hypothetical protein [Primorskyibacter flagellatus]